MSLRTVIAAALLVNLVACNRGKVRLSGEEDADEIDEICDDHADDVLEDAVEVVFEATTGQCPWGQDDNLEMLDTYLTARVEQTETLDLDDQVLLCDMDFDMTGLVPGEVQLMIYDDYFFFTFDDIVLASSHAPAVAEMDTDGGMPVYDWASIAGAPFPVGDAHFCLGEETGDALCEIPNTQTEGPISLRFGRDVTNELSARALAEERFEYGFVTTGDNDPATDCQHAKFGFTVHVEYLEAG